jgi:hypothetical protein
MPLSPLATSFPATQGVLGAEPLAPFPDPHRHDPELERFLHDASSQLCRWLGSASATSPLPGLSVLPAVEPETDRPHARSPARRSPAGDGGCLQPGPSRCDRPPGSAAAGSFCGGRPDLRGPEQQPAGGGALALPQPSGAEPLRLAGGAAGSPRRRRRRGRQRRQPQQPDGPGGRPPSPRPARAA